MHAATRHRVPLLARLALGGATLLGGAVVLAIAFYPRTGCTCLPPEQIAVMELTEMVAAPATICAAETPTLSTRDPWDTPYAMACTRLGGIVVVSAGPDRVFDTDDDILRRNIGGLPLTTRPRAAYNDQ